MTEHRHETTDMDPKYALYFAVGLVIVGLLIQLGILWMFRQFDQAQARRENRPVLVKTPAVVPEPHLQISPQDELQQLRRQEDEVLSTYGWIDRDKGTARIPIDRAMQLFLERQKK
jgi:hypothetical protein